MRIMRAVVPVSPTVKIRRPSDPRRCVSIRRSSLVKPIYPPKCLVELGYTVTSIHAGLCGPLPGLDAVAVGLRVIRSIRILKFFRNYGREGPSELGAYRALGMAGNDVNPGGGPFRIGTLHEQTPLCALTRGVVAEGSR